MARLAHQRTASSVDRVAQRSEKVSLSYVEQNSLAKIASSMQRARNDDIDDYVERDDYRHDDYHQDDEHYDAYSPRSSRSRSRSRDSRRSNRSRHSGYSDEEVDPSPRGDGIYVEDD